MTERSTLRLGAEHIEAFFQASRDANPLHRDTSYARRTPFGRPVAYGMAAVLRALALHMPAGRHRIAALRCEFRKPLFIDTDYELRSTDDGNQQRLRIGRGGIDYTIIALNTREWDGSYAGTPLAHLPAAPFLPPEHPATPTGHPAASAPPPVFEARLVAAMEPLCAARPVHYSIAPGAWASLLLAFDLDAERLPAQQLAALLWMSYHVGMEMPGRQALFADAQVEFSQPTTPAAALSLDLQEAVVDDRFNRFALLATGTGIERLRLSAFRRPWPVVPSLSMADPWQGSQPLRGQRVLVTGAARGFGAAMALVSARAGAQVILHHRGATSEVEDIVQRIRDIGGQAMAVGADLENSTAVERLGQELQPLGPLDFIISNAAPAIADARLVEQSDEDILAFTHRNLAITLTTVRRLLPHLHRGGQFVHISTCYLSVPVPGFTHYLAAKGAQEGLIQALAQEARELQFVIARLPRMLTDQTNAPFSTGRLASPIQVACALIAQLVLPSQARPRLLEIADAQGHPG
ncbi:MAG: SDR family NAD(P)-dependent oxidoreductase [Proteobacteria bacterium]|nr:SDR family NAD(P)-dependent oxidoreductase [Pseudomonadota bacterium]